jgi:hypothetical protein
MSWEVGDAEFDSVLALPAGRRYEYFVKRACGHGQLWGLRAVDGWIVAEDDHAGQHFPVWPHPRFAEAVAAGPWADAVPTSIDIDDWVEAWLPELERAGLRIAVFQTPADNAVGVGPERLRHDLNAELEQFEI